MTTTADDELLLPFLEGQSSAAFNLQALQRVFAEHAERVERAVCTTMTESMADAAMIYFPAPPAPSEQGRLLPVADVAVHPSRLRDLRSFLGDPSAQWSCTLQGALLELILAGRQNLLAVLATGFGKTTLIMMISKMYAPTKTILVVLPLMSLHEDFHFRARKVGLIVDQFRLYGAFHRHANIVTVPVECLQSPAFHR